MKENFLVIACAAIALILTAGFSYCQNDHRQVRERLAKTHPTFAVSEIRETPIAGVFELEVGPNVLYYHPEKNLLIFGEIWTGEGRSLTADRRTEIASRKVRNVPLDKALKVGRGPNKVIEFTDPDCAYCRKLSTFFRGREDVTRYVFFVPLAAHKGADQKVRFILCSDNPERSYEEVMEGKFDGKPMDTCNSETVSDIMKTHRDIGTKTGIQGTPMLWVNNTAVRGANIPIIKGLLTKK
ncbi:MAG TPA: protein-disulfide isomerase [Deltaproteobacteria bacterium]|nr:protein-disulfide isomerase [Deltaproteobacteria bacterium]